MSKNWIASSIKKPGALTAAAKREGESISEYCQSPPSTKAKQRCNLAKTLKSFKHKNGGRLLLQQGGILKAQSGTGTISLNDPRSQGGIVRDPKAYHVPLPNNQGYAMKFFLQAEGEGTDKQVSRSTPYAQRLGTLYDQINTEFPKTGRIPAEVYDNMDLTPDPQDPSKVKVTFRDPQYPGQPGYPVAMGYIQAASVPRSEQPLDRDGNYKVQYVPMQSVQPAQLLQYIKKMEVVPSNQAGATVKTKHMLMNPKHMASCKPSLK